ncbi:MAG TPA: SufD family Fe-S cluster assembly protein, partial [Methylomirabilota bacterium]|nr:SufD family Fe-S cluster assembly protein [Methylomirabilota bacterium]
MTAPASRARPARRALDELSLSVDAGALDAVVATSPDWLAADRRAAFEAWAALPAESNKLYTPYIDLRGAQLESARFVTDHGTERGVDAIPDDAEGLIEFDEGTVTGVALSEAAQTAGVVLRPLPDDVEAVRDLLDGGPSIPATDKFAQLTRALWSQGVVVDVPAGVRLDRPIVIRWAVGAADRALLTRTLIRLGDGAQASVVEELVVSHAVPAGAASTAASAGVGQAFFASTTEVTLGTDSSLQVASLQELGGETVAFQHRHANIGDGATLQWALAQLGGRLVRSRVENRLVGDRSSVEQVEIVFGAEEQLFDLTSFTTHIGRDTTGDLLSKAALLEKARTYLKGLITIEKSAVGTDSFLGEFGMNLSKSARSVAIPSLEIDQPDCRRAMHSSSVGPVDEMQLFYLESRGIPPDEARKFIVLGYLEPVVARVPLASAQAR